MAEMGDAHAEMDFQPNQVEIYQHNILFKLW